MKDPESIQKLERIYGLVARSFIRYIVDAAGPTVRDEWDRKALEAFQAWRAADMAALERIEEVLAAEKVHPQPPTFQVEFSHYHYLGAAYLLKPVIRLMEAHTARIEAESKGLGAWPEAEKAVAGLLEEDRSRLKILQGLEAERPKDLPKPGVKKGVSASRW